MRWLFYFVLMAAGIQGIALQKAPPNHTHAITYENGARFGDRVLGYANARYLSYVTGLQFLHRPFPYSDRLFIEHEALPYDSHKGEYKERFYIQSGRSLFEFFKKIRDPNTPSTLFIVDYFPEELGEWEIDKNRSVAFDIPWRDPEFRDYLNKSLTPRIQIPRFTRDGILNVATHVRTLSGSDTADTSMKNFPLKHPTTDYHKKQVRLVYEWNLKRPMHVFLFSDTKDPHGLIAEFRNEFKDTDIIFDIQLLDKPDLNNVIQDFFGMLQFDVLIATQSNFSIMPAHLGDFDMILYPIHATGRYPNPSRIDQVQLITKPSAWFPYEINTILKQE